MATLSSVMFALSSLWIMVQSTDARIFKTESPVVQKSNVDNGAVSRTELPRTHEPGRSLLQKHFGTARKLSSIVQDAPLILEYHNGPILSTTHTIPVYIVWYGGFTADQRGVVQDFLSSFSSGPTGHPSVSSWWQTTTGYHDSTGSSVERKLELAQVTNDDYSKGRTLTNSDLEALVVKSLDVFPKDITAIYLVITSEDVLVQDFCMNSCGSHFSTAPTEATNGEQLPYGWVGNPATQCPGMCAWPYARPEYGPSNFETLVAPNGDVGMDGIIINLGEILAGMATNPFDNGFFQGDAADPLEAATACAGIYGAGAYPGYPGKLLLDGNTQASYNVVGANGRKFLLPALWNPETLQCSAPE